MPADRRPCSCAGTAPGYPQHESGCGQPETDEDCEYLDGLVAAGPPPLRDEPPTVPLRRRVRQVVGLLCPHPVRSALLRREYLVARRLESPVDEFDLTTDWLTELVEHAVVAYGGSVAPSDGSAVVTAVELAVVTYGVPASPVTSDAPLALTSGGSE